MNDWTGEKLQETEQRINAKHSTEYVTVTMERFNFLTMLENRNILLEEKIKTYEIVCGDLQKQLLHSKKITPAEMRKYSV